MSNQDAHTGFGALLQRGDGQSPENFITMMGVKSINGPNMTRDTHETSTQAQDSNFKTYIGGMADGGEVSFEANFLPRDDTQGQETGFLSEFDQTSCDSLRNWRIVLPECAGESEGYFEFNGVVTAASPTFPMDDIMGMNGTIKVSGRPTLVLLTG